MKYSHAKLLLMVFFLLCLLPLSSCFYYKKNPYVIEFKTGTFVKESDSNDDFGVYDKFVLFVKEESKDSEEPSLLMCRANNKYYSFKMYGYIGEEEIIFELYNMHSEEHAGQMYFGSCKYMYEGENYEENFTFRASNGYSFMIWIEGVGKDYNGILFRTENN